jgi:putative sugar O-methyltransferase
MIVSRYWEVLNARNNKQLSDYGYDNFKRTLALNYFTWIGLPWDVKVRFLVKRAPVATTFKNMAKAIRAGQHKYFTWAQSLSYNFLTFMTWDYMERKVPENIWRDLEEPKDGNPPEIYFKGKLISQDLANSFLEVYSMIDDNLTPATVLELGAGYGRTAFVLLKKFPKLKYIVVDISPALEVCKKYLTAQFPGRDMTFLTPDEVSKLGDKSVDLFINISSLHEMLPEAIKQYFDQIDRLSRYFYFKQWKVSKIPFDNIVITENDYPVKNSWKKIYHRNCAVQANFFEAMYEVC